MLLGALLMDVTTYWDETSSLLVSVHVLDHCSAEDRQLWDPHTDGYRCFFWLTCLLPKHLVHQNLKRITSLVFPQEKEWCKWHESWRNLIFFHKILTQEWEDDGLYREWTKEKSCTVFNNVTCVQSFFLCSCCLIWFTWVGLCAKYTLYRDFIRGD